MNARSHNGIGTGRVEVDARSRTWAYRAPKRAVDIVLAAIALVVASPIMALAAVAIALEDGAPVLFTQRRTGCDGREFTIFKFRTMAVESHRVEFRDAPLEERDPRITRVGRVLRAASIDELPQLVNILAGEMSIVGPRPTIPEQCAAYDDFERRRLEVKPGLTGWAQVNGRNALSWAERIALDVWYVDHASLALDLRVILRTFGVLLRPALAWGGRGTTEEADR